MATKRKPINIDSLESLRTFLTDCMEQARRGLVDPKQAQAVASIAREVRFTLERSEAPRSKAIEDMSTEELMSMAKDGQ